MLTAIVLSLAQIGSSAVPQHDPEIEALLRQRDARREQAAQAPVQTRAPAPEAANDGDSLASVVPPDVAPRLTACLERANSEAASGIADAQGWASDGGGAYAALCHGYALGQDKRWDEAASVFEQGAQAEGLDAVTQASLLSQAGNAALIAGDAPRAARALDAALSRPLPRTLPTGEIHLDRARARVATGDLKGARVDLDQAVVLAAADPLAWLLSATLARRMDDLPLARLHIEEAAKRAGNDAAIALEQGVILALGGNNDAGARAAFSRARELASADSSIATQAADYLAQLDAAAPPAEQDLEAGR